MQQYTKDIILVVDDSPSNLKLLGHILSDEFQPILVTSGEQALEFMQKTVPALIILDVEMPGMDGYETIHHIKANPQTTDIPVIFFSALSDNENELVGLSYGAADYISKPVIPRLLLHRVRMQLELHAFRNKLMGLVDLKTQQILQIKKVTVSTLAGLAECRDEGTGGHIKRTSMYVASLVRAVAAHESNQYEIKPGFIEDIISAAPLHDIGKMGIPDAILLKQGKLTPEELAVMKQHVIIGADAIRQAVRELNFPTFLDVALEMCESHHERWNGNGYPYGLSDENIPLSARIMAIADVYDALVSERPYKRGMSHDDAIEIIRSERGDAFDPFLVDVFLEISDEFKSIRKQFTEKNDSSLVVDVSLMEAF
ncbi:MAG: HD domain-containing phosphohydrolase [Thermoguttaceae bacterium]